MSNSRKIETDKLMELFREQAEYVLHNQNIPDIEKHYLMIQIERMVNNIKQYRGEER